jgi:hypothetical protein
MPPQGLPASVRIAGEPLIAILTEDPPDEDLPDDIAWVVREDSIVSLKVRIGGITWVLAQMETTT